MVVSYWSNERKLSGVTMSLACMSSFFALEGKGREKSIVLENHYNINSLGNLVLTPEKQSILKEKGKYYDKYGVEYLLKHLFMGEPCDDLLSRTSIPLLYSNILYIPQSYIINKEVFNYEFDLIRKKLFEFLQQHIENVYVDLESNQNISTQSILNESDLVVVCLSQNPRQIKQYFENYSALKDRAIYIIGAYRKENIWTKSKICEEYSISEDKIAVIPYNEELLFASKQGKTLQFIHKNHLKPSGLENEYFIREVKKAVYMLKDQMQQIKRRKNSN